MRFQVRGVAVVALAIMVWGVGDTSPSLATSPPSAERFSLDMDPAVLPANTATSIGTRESRASINENNVLDADEDFIDTVEVDVTVTGIPAGNAMTGYGYTLNFSTGLRVVYQQPMLIGPPGVIINSSDALPDMVSPWRSSVSDSSGPAESGSGVLDRLRIEAITSGPILFNLALTDATHTDTDGNTWAPDALDGAQLCIDMPCSNPIDLEMVSMTLGSANPVPNDVSTTVTVSESIRNNGAYSVNTDTQTTFTVPPDCTLNGTTGTVALHADVGILPGATTIQHQEIPSLRCSGGGPHEMPVTGCAVDDDPSFVDWNPGNDCITQTLSFDVSYPDTDQDGLHDGIDPDDDNDLVNDVDEGPCGGNSLNAAIRPERIDGPFAGVDDDGDTQVDEPLPAGAQNYDCDGDGYKGHVEDRVFWTTNPRDQDPCGTDAWPSDFISGGIFGSTNRVLIDDLNTFLSPRKLDLFLTGPGDPNVRWDLYPTPGIFTTDINIGDLNQLLAPPTAFPAMLGGARALNGPECPWPP